MFNTFFMQEALQEASKAFNKNEIPVGAVLVNRLTKKIITRGHNIVQQSRNPLLHAEISVINKAFKILGSKSLTHYDLYVTLEPCKMCAAAISFSKISRLFYGISNIKYGDIEFKNTFYNCPGYHKPEIYDGILGVESKEIIQRFFNKIRRKSY